MPSSMPILHKSLQFIDCYSPQLHRFSASNGLGLPFYRPIIYQSLQFIDCYSPSLRRFSASIGLGLPSFMPILHQPLHFIDCYSLSLRRFSQVSGSDCPLTDLLYISRFILLVSTVLRFASLASIGLRLPSSMPILHLSLHFIDYYSLSFCRFSASIGLGLSPRLSISKDT